MAQEWKETELKRNDIKSIAEKTLKLIEMYSEVIKLKREGWEKMLAEQQKREEEENGNS
tara:strand:+ start:1285 stop:1461 length:177 start_codon:yes stop_codon:yes gene_type:complete